jgi:hypothetical protein
VHSAETVARSMEIVGRRFWSCRLPYPWRASRQGPPSTSDQSFGTDETTLATCVATRVRPGGRRLRLLTTIGATTHPARASAQTPDCVAARHDRRRNRGNEHGQPAVPVVVDRPPDNREEHRAEK